MAITISGTNITFNDTTTQSTAATAGTSLGAVQYGAYGAITTRGTQTFSTSVTAGLFDGQAQPTTAQGGTVYYSNYGIIPQGGNVTTSVICGFQYYRSGTSAANDGAADAGVIQRRMAYRTVS